VASSLAWWAASGEALPWFRFPIPPVLRRP